MRRRTKLRQILVRYPRGLPVAIFLAVALIALVAAYSIERGERQEAQAQLRERATAVAAALERRANENASYLRAGAALFTTMGAVPAARFRRFVEELQLDADNRGIEAIGWARRIEPDQVEAFNRVIGDFYGEDVRLYPDLPQRAGSFAIPVTYLEPENERNRAVIGFDMHSEPTRRAAMAEAERNERPTASGKLRLLQREGDEAPGFMIFMPAFSEMGDGASGEPGPHRLVGFVYSVFGARQFLQSTLRTEAARDLGVRLYDREASPANLVAEIDPPGQRGSSLVIPVEIANHPWSIEVTSARPRLLSALAVATLMFGVSVAVLLTVLVRVLTQQAIEDGRHLSWLEEQTSIRDSLARELNHRVKNTLANVLSIIALTRRRSSSLDDFAESLEGRIRALSATHDLLVKSEWGTTPVGAVIGAELAPYARDAGPKIVLDGPDNVVLAPKDALSLGLAIHELATNAAKYGALSNAAGQLRIAWHPLDGDRLVRIDWIERGGPPVSERRGRGFGLDLIEKIVAHEMRNPVDLRFEREGVSCTLIVPVREPSPFTIRQGA